MIIRHDIWLEQIFTHHVIFHRILPIPMTRPDRGWGYVPPVSPVLPSVYKQYVWQN